MNAAKKALVSLAYHSGLIALRGFLGKRPGFRILMYHHVTDRPEPFLPHVTAEVFARQIGHLAGHCRVVDLDWAVDEMGRGNSLPRNSVALTFDDEYDDVYRNAFPLLKIFAVPATIFITTGFVDTPKVPWTDQLGFLFKATARTELEYGEGKGRVRFRWGDDRSKQEAFRDLKRCLKAMDDSLREEVFREIASRLDVRQPNPARILGGGQIREMASAGIAFGSHTVNHPILTRIPAEAARREIVESKRQLEKITGRAVSGFCYPNGEEGDFNREIKKMVREAGFSYACTSIEGVNGRGSDAYELRRTWTSEPSLPRFAARLAR